MSLVFDIFHFLTKLLLGYWLKTDLSSKLFDKCLAGTLLTFLVSSHCDALFPGCHLGLTAYLCLQRILGTEFVSTRNYLTYPFVFTASYPRKT